MWMSAQSWMRAGQLFPIFLDLVRNTRVTPLLVKTSRVALRLARIIPLLVTIAMILTI